MVCAADSFDVCALSKRYSAAATATFRSDSDSWKSEPQGNQHLSRTHRGARARASGSGILVNQDLGSSPPRPRGEGAARHGRRAGITLRMRSDTSGLTLSPGPRASSICTSSDMLQQGLARFPNFLVSPRTVRRHSRPQNHIVSPLRTLRKSARLLSTRKRPPDGLLCAGGQACALVTRGAWRARANVSLLSRPPLSPAGEGGVACVP